MSEYDRNVGRRLVKAQWIVAECDSNDGQIAVESRSDWNWVEVKSNAVERLLNQSRIIVVTTTFVYNWNVKKTVLTISLDIMNLYICYVRCWHNMDAFLKGVSAKPKDLQTTNSGTSASSKETHKRKPLQPWVEK